MNKSNSKKIKYDFIFKKIWSEIDLGEGRKVYLSNRILVSQNSYSQGI